MSLYFAGRSFSSERLSSFTVGPVHTGLQCVPPFLFVQPSLSDSTHRTSVCSLYVDLEFFVGYDTVKLLPTFSRVPHFLRFALAFRTRRHTPSPVVANAPPPLLSCFFSVSFAVFFSLIFPIFQLAPRTVAFFFIFFYSSPPTAPFAFSLDSVQ